MDSGGKHLPNQYSTVQASQDILASLLADSRLPLLPLSRTNAERRVILTEVFSQPIIPINLKAGESFSALKALEAGIALAISDLRYEGFDPYLPEHERSEDSNSDKAVVNVAHAALFPVMTFLSDVDGYRKSDKHEISARLRDTDVSRVYSDVYRRSVTNIYKTKDEKFYHLHASLNADPVFGLLGLPSHNEKVSLQESQSLIAAKASQLTSQELDDKVITARIAGSPCLTREQYLSTPQGRHILSQPLFGLQALESTSAPFKPSPGPNVLSNVKILDLTRIIAGPVITRTLAEYGADVIRVTNLKLPDSTYYQVDFNFGKRTVDLDLKSATGRSAFEKLLDDADVIVDGYRPGAMEKLGYGPSQLVDRFRSRGKGFVYLSENCYGWGGPWSERPGWQQIADSFTGVSWHHGRSMGKDEPVAPPFPLADFGAGETGCIAVLNALHHRIVKGGSYRATVSLAKYNDWLMSLGPLPPVIWEKLISEHDMVGKVAYNCNFDIVGNVAHDSMRRLHPELFDEGKYMLEAQAHFGRVRTLSPVVKMKYKEGWLNPTRWPGWDEPKWLDTK